MLSPFRMVCRDFILPEFCKPCLFLSTFQFAKLILPYRIRRYRGGIAVSIFIYCNPPNALRSKKAMLRKRDIPAMNVNCQFKGYFPLPPLALSRRYWKAKSSGFFYSVLPKSIESRICHHLSFLLNVITAWHIKPNTREKQPPPNSDAPHPAPDIVIKPPTKKIPMPRNIPTP